MLSEGFLVVVNWTIANNGLKAVLKKQVDGLAESCNKQRCQTFACSSFSWSFYINQSWFLEILRC